MGTATSNILFCFFPEEAKLAYPNWLQRELNLRPWDQ